MTRFDATTPDERPKLFVDAIDAHRERGSPFLTIEVEPPGETVEDDDSNALIDRSNPLDADPDPSAIRDDAERTAGADEGDDAEQQVPWIQFADGVLNLDCTDEELDRLESLLGDYPAFRIDALESPDDAEGTNLRITARADANRVAGFVERAFREVYDLPEGYRGWVVEV
jgi:hypothetical protein